MLPEKLFTSPQAEPNTDTSVLQKQAFSGSDNSLDSNTQEFKNALSSSMSTDKQIQQKQRHSKQIQSNTSNENQSINMHNYHHGETINTQVAINNTDGEDPQSVKASVDKKDELSTAEEGKQFNINLSQNINPVYVENTAGEKVATDGKVLPDQLLNKARIIQGPVSQEQMNSSNAEYKGQSNKANIQSNEASQNRLLSNSDEKIANTITNTKNGKVVDAVVNKTTEVPEKKIKQNRSNATKGFEFLNHPVKGNQGTIKQEELLSSLKKLNPEKTGNDTGLSNKELQQKLASMPKFANINVTKEMNAAVKSSSSGELNSKIDLHAAALATSGNKQKLSNISIDTVGTDPKTLLSAYSSKSLDLDTVKSKLSEGNNFTQKLVSNSAENLIQSGVLKQDEIYLQKGKGIIAEVLTANDTSNSSTAKPATPGTAGTAGTAVANDTATVQTAQLNNAQTVTKPAEFTLPVSLPPHQWKQKFAEQVSMMILRGNTKASIRLDPPELGPMAIRVNHSGAETQIQFQVSNPIARDLIDSGMQRLREMLEQHGFENVDVDVREQGERTQDSSESLADSDDLDEDSDLMSRDLLSEDDPYQSKSLVDIFA